MQLASGHALTCLSRLQAKRVLLPRFSLIYYKANYPKSLPFSLKSTFAFEIHCKKHLPTPKEAAKKDQIDMFHFIL